MAMENSTTRGAHVLIEIFDISAPFQFGAPNLNVLVLGASVAISAIKVNHQHLDGVIIDHAAELDGNGCHEGPGGFHCH